VWLAQLQSHVAIQYLRVNLTILLFRIMSNIGDAARQTGAPSPIGFAQNMVRIAQERETEAGIVGKGSVIFDRIKAHAENLHIALREGVIEGEEPAPFGGSAPGAGFGIKPQDDLLPAEIP